MKRRGKKTAAWESTRAKLKVRFFNIGLTYCELCGSTFALSFAHSLKRNDIKTQEQLEECVLLCQGCHRLLEDGNKYEMHRRILEIIAARETAV